MDALHAFERDAYLTALTTRILRAGVADGGPYVLLEDTLFYPEGGGQPGDRGTINGVPLRDVQKADGEVRHFLAAPLAEGPAELRLDWARRFDHMQQHTGQHLLTALAQDRFGWATTAFHLGERVSDIELDAPQLAPGDLDRLECAVAEAIRAARAVTARRVDSAAYAAERVRSRGLPEGHRGDIRLVAIADLDLNTCGGTHLRSTAELESLKLLGTEPLRGGTRLFYVAGVRTRHRLGDHEARNAAFRTLLGAPDEGLVAALEGRLDQLRQAERRIRHLEEAFATTLAAALAARPGPLVEYHADGQDVAFLGRVGRAFTALAPQGVAFLTAVREGAAYFALAASPQAGVDLAALGREVAALLEGRGGGSAPVFQGKAGGLKARAECLERLAAGLAGRPLDL